MEFWIKSEELLSLRMAARKLYEAVTRLDEGEVEKFVLLDNKNDIRAVILSPAAYARLVDAAQDAAPPRAA